MGLDQYAYVATKSLAEGRADTEERDLAYWRKHGSLQRWMQKLWAKKGKHKNPDRFNGVELELTWEDLDALEKAVVNKRLPDGEHWYGSVNTDYYLERDLAFIKAARAELFMGLRVFYYPSW